MKKTLLKQVVKTTVVTQVCELYLWAKIKSEQQTEQFSINQSAQSADPSKCTRGQKSTSSTDTEMRHYMTSWPVKIPSPPDMR